MSGCLTGCPADWLTGWVAGSLAGLITVVCPVAIARRGSKKKEGEMGWTDEAASLVLHVISESQLRRVLAMGEDPFGPVDGQLPGFSTVSVPQKLSSVVALVDMQEDKENVRKVLKEEVAASCDPPTPDERMGEADPSDTDSDEDDFENALEEVEIEEAATEFEHEFYEFINEGEKSASPHSNCAVPQLAEENYNGRPAERDGGTVDDMEVDLVDGPKATEAQDPPGSDNSPISAPGERAQTVPSLYKDDRVVNPLSSVALTQQKPKSESGHEESEGSECESEAPDTEDVASLSAIKLYPSGSVTPSQAPPFTPRFGPPVQGVSPQYPNAADLRSPGLMSPTQSLRPQCLPGVPLEPLVPNMNMMRVATQPSHFYGHDVHFSMPLDMCLMGCNFFLVENERNLNDKHDLANLSAVIKYHGGDLKWGNQGYTDRTTHVICESYQHATVRNDCRKRCVTLQWLNEVLIRKRMEAPWKFCHLPSFWNEAKRPPSGTGKAIAVCGWSDIELINVKMMISAIGARFSPHLSCENDYLIARCESEKVERAREMGVKVLNYRWLLDAYTGICNGYPDSENLNYVLGTGEPCPEVSTTPYMMERHSDVYNKLLAPWKIPIIVNQELFNIGMELRKSIENNENIFPFKKVKQLTPAPTDEQIVQAQNILRELGETLPKCVIYFSGILPDDEKNLAKKAEFLGAEITTEVEKCTHFVCVSLLRTVELMKAIAMGKHIVSHNYIVYGYMILQFPDTYDLYLHDDENEKNYGYNLKTSIFRARSQAIFEDCIFHIMPSVHPSYKILSELVRISGGIVEEERPSPQFLADCIEYERPYFIIGCDADLHLYHYLMDCKYPIYNEEFVMLAVLRQEFDTSSNYLVNSNTIPPAVSTPSTPIQSRLPPAATMNGTANPLQNAAQQRVKAQ
uniref:PAX-interacting protein 1 n=1 Tax=Steinernema glaseri TaxID=37863 RepID=A0A1I7Z176_9BILA